MPRKSYARRKIVSNADRYIELDEEGIMEIVTISWPVGYNPWRASWIPNSHSSISLNLIVIEAEELDQGVDRQTIAFREMLKDSGMDSD